MKKIAMYDLEGHLLEIFDFETAVELEKQLKIPQGSLNGCLSGKQLSTINRQFRVYSGRIINRIGDISMLSNTWVIPVHKYYKGKYICSYYSANKAAEVNNIPVQDINKCLKGKYNKAGGFEWKYAN
jgi:hypothetical protein